MKAGLNVFFLFFDLFHVFDKIIPDTQICMYIACTEGALCSGANVCIDICTDNITPGLETEF